LKFSDFNFHPDVQQGLDAMRFDTPTPIQQKAIPLILQGKDLVACAQTGTGKTAAFVLPILHNIASSSRGKMNTLIIAPTRELAMQIDQQIEGFAYFAGISSVPIYGGGDGQAWDVQKNALVKGADIITATPGRLISQISSGKADFSGLQFLILDEADRMLDMGFYEDIIRIIDMLPKNRQTLLFSATMPPKIRKLANQILRDPEEIVLSPDMPAEGILQKAFVVYDHQKQPLLFDILDNGNYQSIILFAGRKETVKKLASALKRKRRNVEAFHSDLVQSEREQILLDFKHRKIDMLIGTDILSRGIDVEGIDLVVNYDVPGDPEDYVHRVGRTARASATGTAISFVNEDDFRKWYRIEELIKRPIDKSPLPQGLGEAPEYREASSRGNRNSKNRYAPSSGGNKSGKKRFFPKHKKN
jgi:ATP-dependent RNA helicase RhlE